MYSQNYRKRLEQGPRVLPARPPDVFRRVAEREPIRMQGFILKSFGSFLLALENSDLFKVDISKATSCEWERLHAEQSNARGIIRAIRSSVVSAFGGHL
jgi:hypothetical protein